MSVVSTLGRLRQEDQQSTDLAVQRRLIYKLTNNPTVLVKVLRNKSQQQHFQPAVAVHTFIPALRGRQVSVTLRPALFTYSELLASYNHTVRLSLQKKGSRGGEVGWHSSLTTIITDYK